MRVSVDLNADLGEGFGPWRMADDAALLGIVSSANIACGFHAGDPEVMDATLRAALAAGVSVGAHPGLPDLQGFGRRRMQLGHDSLASIVRYQVAAAAGMIRAAGGRLAHVKLHGALSNMACEDAALARVALSAAREVVPEAALFVLPATAMEAAARDLGGAIVAEAFADRGYAPDGRLLDRGAPGSVLHDADAVARRAVEMVRSGWLPVAGGRNLPARIDSLCVHGDTPDAVGLARAVREGLLAAGIAIGPPL